ncbi:ribonuclease HI [Aliterella atlantica]|uniref:Ribonuclease H n=1 Tax=Aliterella atlantica CENA595 TaxID=1618023 RepID=A0A0D8ZRY2_9CYAN|nr:ribonuclease HI [Aliterella atlantica]KJH71107.1 ribonuclease H [Aliterella atlantica CENA595]
MSSSRKIQSIYTDGACTGNPGPGGWAVVVYYTDNCVHEFGGGEKQTTNNRMEMQAAIAALNFLVNAQQKELVTLYTDSEYLINGATKWVKSWKKRGWKTAQNKPVLNQDLWEALDSVNSKQIAWQHVRGHAGNVGNERCDAIARAFANGKTLSLQQEEPSSSSHDIATNHLSLDGVADVNGDNTIIDKNIQTTLIASDATIMDSPAPTSANSEELPRELRVAGLRSLIDTLRIAEEIAAKGFLITSSELADLMDVHASAVTSRGDEWRWRNWIVSRVRREGNQILWELERGDEVNSAREPYNSDPATE